MFHKAQQYSSYGQFICSHKVLHNSKEKRNKKAKKILKAHNQLKTRDINKKYTEHMKQKQVYTNRC